MNCWLAWTILDLPIYFPLVNFCIRVHFSFLFEILSCGVNMKDVMRYHVAQRKNDKKVVLVCDF